MSQSQLQRTFQILSIIAENNDGISYTDINLKSKDIAIATMARLLKSMTHETLIQKDKSGLYFLGPAAIQFAHKAVTSGSIIEEIRPFINKLAQDTNQSGAYFEWDGDNIKTVCKKDIPGSIYYRKEGSRNDRVATHPASLVLLAYSHDSLVDFICENFIPEEKLKEFNKHIDKIRKTGFFAGSDPGYQCSRVVYPVIVSGRLFGCVSVCSLELELNEEVLSKYTFAVENCAQKIAQKLVNQKQ